MTFATAALLLTTALAAPAVADSYNGQPNGYAQNHNGYGDHNGGGAFNDRDYSQGFHDRDFGEHGRFYYNGNVRQRLERLEHLTKFLARDGELNRWEANRAFDMLREIRFQVFKIRQDGYVSPWEKARLNRKLDQLVMFLRDARHDGRGWNRYDNVRDGYRQNY
jgi:hypothetical protein